ncbi:MAG TPA: sugar ABC transporter permease [Aggregatilineales bacterium]|nr:sugar ABC transporter permease [Aggregatilineales bacterium]
MQRIARKAFPTHIFVFLLPAIIIYTLFMIYPLFDSLRLSFYDQSVINQPATGNLLNIQAPNFLALVATRTSQPIFVGLDNFHTLLGDPNWAGQFKNALGNNFVFFSIHMLVQNPLALFLATLLTAKFLRGRAIYRTLIFAPTTLSVVIIGFIWKLLLNQNWGIVDGFLKGIGLGALIQPWLGSDITALPVVSLISVWQWVALPMVLFMAALVSIPEELLEAARVDGASAWRIFTEIKFPLVLPTVGIVGVLTFVGNFNAFDLIYTMQGLLATPNYHTDILGTFFFRTFYGFQLKSGNPTMGTTIAAMMFLIILTGVLIYMFGWQRRIARIQG